MFLTAIVAAVLTTLVATPAGALAAVPDYDVYPNAGRVATNFTFTVTAPDPDPLAVYTWDFGDGTGTVAGPQVTHSFAASGSKTVTLTATDTLSVATTATHIVDVYDPPTAAFTYSPAVPSVNQTVSFDGTGSVDPSGSKTYAWSFGDGDTATGAKPTHIYDTGGPQTVTLTTTADLDGKKATSTQQIRVNRAPTAGITYGPAKPRTDTNMTFTSTSTDPDGGADIAAVAWDLNNNGTYETPGTTVGQTFGAGSHTVKVRVTDAAGATDTATKTFTVYGLPSATFGSSPTVVNVGQPVSFDGSGSSDPAGSTKRYSWSYGDGATASDGGAKPSHAYATGGDKLVTLTTIAAYDDRPATTTRTIHVNSAPFGDFSYSPGKPSADVTVTFSAAVSDPDGAADLTTPSWDLNGNGTYEVTGATVFTQFATGTHTVAMKVTDKAGAFMIVTKTITVTALPSGPDPPSTGPGTGTGSGGGTGQVTGGSSSTNGSVTTVSPTGKIIKVSLKAPTGVRVQITGSVTGSRTRITRIVVLSPAGWVILAHCKGSGCPKRGVRASSRGRGGARLRALERTFRAGNQLVITATHRGFASKRIIVTARRGRAPSRTESCLIPGTRRGTTRVARCPSA